VHPTVSIGAAGELLYLSAMLLAVLWAVVLLFVVYPSQPLDTGYTDEDVPVVSPEGNLVTVKKDKVAQVLGTRGFMAPSGEQLRLWSDRRAATVEAVRRDKQVWFLLGAVFPGAALLLLRAWWFWLRKP
jgi:hypothetical protein